MPPKMRPSRVLEKLRQDKMVSCFKVNTSDARVSDIVGMAGYDCQWLDIEHIANDWTVVEQQIWAGKVHNMDSLVRVSRGGYSDYIKPLELDAAGIMVPHIMNAEDARNVVRMTRFMPTGRRPFDGGNADGRFCTIPMKDYLEQANANRFVIVQIEDPEPLDELEEIAAIDGIDMLLFGPGDFSHSIGIPGETNDKRVTDVRDRIAKVARDNGKYAGTVSAWPLDELADLGYRFVSKGADVVALAQYTEEMMNSYRKCKHYADYTPDSGASSHGGVYGSED